LGRGLGPLAAGAIIDAVDLATFGPVGVWIGMLAGGAVGWWLAPSLGFSRRHRWLCAALTGVYCTLPMTGFLPVATLVGGTIRLLSREPESGGDAIEAEFRSLPDSREDS
jgi:hypothetical protein